MVFRGSSISIHAYILVKRSLLPTTLTNSLSLTEQKRIVTSANQTRNVANRQIINKLSEKSDYSSNVSLSNIPIQIGHRNCTCYPISE